MFSFLNNRKEYLLTSVVLGVFGTLAHKIVFSGSVSGNNTMNYFKGVKGVDFICFLTISILIFSLMVIIEKNNPQIVKILCANKTSVSPKTVWLYSSILLAFAWLPYLLTFAPGSVLGDSFASINQALNGKIISNHHPVFYTLIVSFFIKLSQLGGGGKI